MFHGVPNIGEGIVELSHCQPVTIFWWTNLDQKYINLREDINEKKTFSFGHCPNEGGGSTLSVFPTHLVLKVKLSK